MLTPSSDVVYVKTAVVFALVSALKPAQNMAVRVSWVLPFCPKEQMEINNKSWDYGRMVPVRLACYLPARFAGWCSSSTADRSARAQQTHASPAGSAFVSDTSFLRGANSDGGLGKKSSHAALDSAVCWRACVQVSTACAAVLATRALIDLSSSPAHAALRALWPWRRRVGSATRAAYD
jgi:hypothetical protein